jgi:hypothetical protein
MNDPMISGACGVEIFSTRSPQQRSARYVVPAGLVPVITLSGPVAGKLQIGDAFSLRVRLAAGNLAGNFLQTENHKQDQCS